MKNLVLKLSIILLIIISLFLIIQSIIKIPIVTSLIIILTIYFILFIVLLNKYISKELNKIKSNYVDYDFMQTLTDEIIRKMYQEINKDKIDNGYENEKFVVLNSAIYSNSNIDNNNTGYYLPFQEITKYVRHRNYELRYFVFDKDKKETYWVNKHILKPKKDKTIKNG